MAHVPQLNESCRERYSVSDTLASNLLIWFTISNCFTLRHISIKLASHEVENCPDKSQLPKCHNSEDATSGWQMLGDNKYVLFAKIIQSAQN